jgi:hypothetical protein
MRRYCLTKPTQRIAGLLAGLLFAILAVPLIAQPASAHGYNVSAEVTLSGTVSSVLHRAAPGMMWGSHLMIETASGSVDASLGRWGLEGKDAPSIAAGQRVEVTGIMRTLHDKEVFVVRTLKSDGKTFTIRNARGLAVSPQARQRAAEKGESL